MHKPQPDFSSLKVAIVHYWLVGMRGGEKVVESLLELFPQAVIITHVYDPDSVSPAIRKQEVRETFIARLPGARKYYQKYLPLMPLALELVDMQEFDLVISSESGPAKGIIPRPDAVHLCYCHSPMRYIWDQYHVYWETASWASRTAMPLLAHRLRIWDVTSAARVDRFIANSRYVGQRIESFYRRDAHVIAPPVDTDAFQPEVSVGDHYLMAGEMVSYKRPDLVIEAFNASGRKLIVSGDGEMRKMLEAKAGPNISFIGRIPFEQLKKQFATCRALIFPGTEDFGIVPVEVMATGRPVIAYGRGGVLDTVLDEITGLFFGEQTVESLNSAIDRLETMPHLLDDPMRIRTHAEKFHESAFLIQFEQITAEALSQKVIA